MKEFKFGYMTTKSTVQLNGMNVHVQRGPFIKMDFLFSNIIHFYKFDNKGHYHQLIIRYYDEKKSKEKNLLLFSDAGDWGFRALVDEFTTTIPAKSLNHLPEKEAFQVLKMSNPKKAGTIGAGILIFLLVSILFYPGLRHFFDFGFEKAHVSELVEGKDFGTRNLVLSGVPSDYIMEETTGSKSGTTHSYYLPLVTAGWSEEKPVKVILKFDDESESSSALGQTEFVGVVRNIAWEGLDDEHIVFYQSDYQLNMGEDVVLFEVTGKEHNDSLMFGIWAGLLGIFGIIFLIVYLKNK
jgi:hypothetical protein